MHKHPREIGSFSPRGICLVALVIVGSGMVPIFPTARAYQSSLVWTANFETGNNSQFDGALQSTCLDGKVGVSSTIRHSGNYAGYYYGRGSMTSAHESCREYKELNLAAEPYVDYGPIVNFHFKMWVYVEKTVIAKWVSFATFGDANAFAAFTIDGDKHNELQLFVSLGHKIVDQNLIPSPLDFPFNQWFSLSLYVYNLGSPDATVIIYLDGIPIISYQGFLLDGPFVFGHFGLYMNNLQPTLTVYNDDLQLWKLM